jgi:hypothetical protein
MGDTVESLQRRMSSREWTQWTAYVDLYGPVDQQRRYDEPSARVAAVVAQVHGNSNKTALDFMPYTPKPDATPAGTLIFDPELHEHFKA